MAYTLANLQSDIRSYTEVGSSVLTDAILNTIIKNSAPSSVGSTSTGHLWFVI